jgi:hypothetical protein
MAYIYTQLHKYGIENCYKPTCTPIYNTYMHAQLHTIMNTYVRTHAYMHTYILNCYLYHIALLRPFRGDSRDHLEPGIKPIYFKMVTECRSKMKYSSRKINDNFNVVVKCTFEKCDVYRT